MARKKKIVEEQKKVVYARYNHGRWIADCPTGDGGAVRVEPGQKFICDICYKGINASGYLPLPDGLYKRVPDLELRAFARAKAEAEGKVYDVVFPAFKADIERVCFNRLVANMNWETGDTLQDLIDDNVKYGVETPEIEK